jgi:Uma2 family endonuclease
LILDPTVAQRFIDERSANGHDNYEVWDGRVVVAPMPNNEHYFIAMKLAEAFSANIDWDRGERALPGGNVSDRDDEWEKNYRNPDLLVVLEGSTAIDRGSRWLGGPDLVVEIISPGEEPQAKFDFYAKVKTREVLIVDRNPWAVELYRLKGKKLILVGRSDEEEPQTVASAVLPLTFKLIAGKPRSRIEVTHPKSKKTWMV